MGKCIVLTFRQISHSVSCFLSSQREAIVGRDEQNADMGDENPYDSDHVSQENCDILADTVGPESHSNPSEKESKHKCCTCKIKTHAGDYDKISTQSFECIGISPSYHYKNLSNLSDQNFHKELKKLVWFHKTEVDIQLYDEALKKLQHENDKLLDLLNNYNKKIKDDIDAYCNKIWSFIKEYFHYDAKEKSQEEINAYEEFINKRNLLQKLEEECKKKKAKASGLHNKIRTISQGPHILSMNHTIKALEKRVEQLTDDNERIMRYSSQKTRFICVNYCLFLQHTELF